MIRAEVGGNWIEFRTGQTAGGKEAIESYVYFQKTNETRVKTLRIMTISTIKKNEKFPENSHC